MSILTSADQSSSFISVSQLMIVRTSPLPLVRWLFPVKKETEGLISPSFAETLWKLTKLVGRGQRQKRGSLPNNFKEHLNLRLQTIPCHEELIVIYPDTTPNVAFAALLFFFFFLSFLQSARPVEWNQIDCGWSIPWPNTAGSYV